MASTTPLLLIGLYVVATAAAAQVPSGIDTRKVGEQEIVSIIKLPGSRAAVFDAMTQCTHLLQWMQPAPMKMVACSTTPRAGGTLTYVFEAPQGRRLEVRGRYEKVESPHTIRYRESYDFSPLQFDVQGAFEEAGGATIFTQTLHYRSREERDTDFPNVAGSQPGVYANLAKYLARPTVTK